jgi:hypothetical protein
MAFSLFPMRFLSKLFQLSHHKVLLLNVFLKSIFATMSGLSITDRLEEEKEETKMRYHVCVWGEIFTAMIK